MESTRAVVALTVDRTRVGIVAVGEEEADVEKRLLDFDAAAKQGIKAQIVAAAEKRLGTTTEEAQPKIRFFRPGDDAWWDEKWQDPYSLRHGDPRRSESPREVLMVEPLHRESWSPHLIRGLLMYVLYTSPRLRGRTWPAFRRPTIELEVADEIQGIDFEEVVDQLRSLWGPSRVVLAGDRAVSPLPRTRLELIYRVSRGIWWAALASMIVLSQSSLSGSEPPALAIVAALVAAVALFVSRVAKGRHEAERPRRR